MDWVKGFPDLNECKEGDKVVVLHPSFGPEVCDVVNWTGENELFQLVRGWRIEPDECLFHIKLTKPEGLA